MNHTTVVLPSIVRGVTWTALLQISSMLLLFFIAVLSARLIGVQEYSTLQFSIGWINILNVVCGLGLATVVLRSSGEASSTDDWGELKGLVRFALSASGLAVIAMGMLGATGLRYFSGSNQLLLLLIGLFLIAIQQQRSIFQSLLNGQALFLRSGLGEFVSNLSLAAFLGGMLTLQSRVFSSAEDILTLRLCAATLGLAVLVFTWLNFTKKNLLVFRLAQPSYRPFKWMRSGLPIMLIAGASIINTNADIVMIGSLHDRGAVGPYHAATRGAGLVIFSLSVLIVPLSPIISKLYKVDARRMFEIVFKWTKVAFASSLAVSAALLIFADWFLLLFGEGFLVARHPMIILILAQLVNVLVGPMQQVLVMAGFERIAAACMIAGTGTNIVANAILIPKYGMEGAAIGTALSILVWNVLSLTSVYVAVWKNHSE